MPSAHRSFVAARALDAQGTPMAGVEVGADDTLLYDSNALGITDADGYLHYGGTGWVYEDLDTDGIEDWGLVSLTLVPAGPLVDGSAGQSLEVQPDQGGALTDIPIGRYTVTATNDGQNPLVRPRNEGDFASSAEAGFVAATTAGTMELEVRLP